MLKAKISGMCLKAYVKKYVGKDGQPKEIQMADFYVGNDLVQVAKVPVGMFAEGIKATDIPVKVYNGKFNLSVVYDDSDF